MKKVICLILIVVMVVISMTMLVGCGNRAWISDKYKNEFTYILAIEPTGEVVLHTIKKWADSDSESITIQTACCDNYMWVSSNNATLYKEYPHYLHGTFRECSK